MSTDSDLSHYVEQAWSMVKKERKRQIEVERFTRDHDEAHSNGELRLAAIAYRYAANEQADVPDYWPFEPVAWKPKDRIRNLIRAGALYMAEKERLWLAGDYKKSSNTLEIIQDVCGELAFVLKSKP